jgi:hypothetical protein
MNKKIVELAEQATIQEGSHGAFGEPTINEYVDLEKFAELIVRECAKVACKLEQDDTDFRHVSTAIEEHFGVEE